MSSLLTLAIAQIPFLPPNKRLDLANRYTSLEDFSRLTGKDLFELASDLRYTKNREFAWQVWQGKQAISDAYKLEEQLQKRHIGTVGLLDDAYPKLLKEIYDPPFLLFYRGKLPKKKLPQLAIVGTRKPSLIAKEETRLFTREAAPHLGSIVSGLALGIDGHAHRAALAAKAHTTAVLGGGFDHIYPSGHKSLAARIIDEGGLILSEYAPSVSPTQYTFPARNRIIAGLTQGTLIIEAPHKSGSLITGQFALDNGRDLFVHAVGLTNLDSGTGELHDQGAMALKRGEDLLSLWNISTKKAPSPSPRSPKPPIVPSEVRKEGGVYNIGAAIANDLWNELSDEDLSDLF